MAGEKFPVLTNEVGTVPAGVAGTGLVTQNPVDDKIINGDANTLFDTEIGTDIGYTSKRPFIFIPGTTPPQLLEVVAVNGKNWLKVKVAPAVTVTAQAFKIVFATLKQWGLLNQGNATAYLNGDSSNGVPIDAGATYNGPPITATGSSGYVFKDVIFVDATGTIVEVLEQP